MQEFELPPPAEALALAAPVVAVTLLEDRAMVRREGQITLAAGRHRLRVADVAPVLQDLSLRAEATAGEASVADARVRRALRVRRSEKPEAVRALDDDLRRLAIERRRAFDAGARAGDAYARVGEILSRSAAELPEDVSWGLADREGWAATFTDLFGRGRTLADQALDARFALEDAERELARASARRAAYDRPDQHVVAHVELDVEVAAAGEIALAVVYTVPNALWRPLHQARLGADDTLRIESRAAIWQRTGEDWTDVRLSVSTARSALGTEPPLLADDLLAAQRRSEQVAVEMREVEVQNTGPSGGGGPPSDTVALPGVDDGGQVRTLSVDHPVTIMGDGRPHFATLFAFETKPTVERVLMAEVDARVHLRVEARHAGPHPLLAGPVELVREAGVVGWTRLLYVASGAPFELGFGPCEALRAVRDVARTPAQVDRVDKWRRVQTRVVLSLSNLGAEPQTVRITERVPVSEVPEATITIETKGTDGPTEADANGFVVRTETVPPHGQGRYLLTWTLATAPGVAKI
ncbi:MAG: mucoidy inhibitor MuiA family protein [Myxococcales bacterium]|nr:mucoidy inhibitor MuiA family protein [Myxococcales bacterium]